MYILDSEKDDKKKHLTVGEVLERLKKNPDDPDPEVREFKKSFDEFRKAIVLPHKGLAETILATRESYFTDLLGSISQTAVLDSVIKSVAESLSVLHFDFEQLTAPSRLITENFARLHTPLISSILIEHENLSPLVPIYEIDDIEVEPVSTKRDFQELQEEVKELRSVVKRLHEDQPQLKYGTYYYDKGTGSFVIKTTSLIALSLGTERENTGTNSLFSVLIEILEENGKKVSDFIQVEVPEQILISRLRAKGLEVSKEWIKSTKSNLIHKKIGSAKLGDLVVLGKYDKKINGFLFKIKLDPKL